MIPLLFAAWLHLASPNFELFTDAGEKQGRDALRRLEVMREVFARPTPLPIRVILFNSQKEWRQVRPSERTGGFYQSGPELDSIAIVQGEESARIVNHEYVHLVLNHGSARLPRWLEEGTAEFYSTLDAAGERVLIGKPIVNHIRELARGQWLTADALQSVQSGQEHPALPLFYAQSWALVHMLNVAPPYRKHMPRYAELLDQSVPPPLAFEQAFGKSVDAALRDLAIYLRQGRFATAAVLVREQNPEITVKPADIEAPVVLTELLLQVGHTAAAEKYLQKLPDTPQATTARALAALAQKRNADALRLFRAAIDAGATAALPYFEYAMLLRDSGAPRDQVRRYLAEAGGRNPNLAEAQFLIGLLYQQEGKHREAVSAFESAARILPRQSYFWHALAVSYLDLNDTARARRAALRAAENAATEHELDMAQAALRQTTGSAPSAGTTKPATPGKDVIIPKGWEMPKGDNHVEGTLEQIDCQGRTARFQIRVNGKPMRFLVQDPGEVLLNTPSAITFEFSCGPQRPRKVAIEFKLHPAADGQITAIEFR